MSLVGTRPPTVDEWDKYELHHRARLATKPGLTGMWQVSGRSNITDLLALISMNDTAYREAIEYLYPNKRPLPVIKKPLIVCVQHHPQKTNLDYPPKSYIPFDL